MEQTIRTKWFKEKDFKFNLDNLNEEKQITIWADWEKRGQPFKQHNGEDIQFPIKLNRPATMKGKDDQYYDSQQALSMNAKDFRELFPDFKMDLSYQRDVIVNGERGKYQFKFTSNKKLKEQIETVKGMGGDPLNANFHQTFDRTQSAANMYGMKIVGMQPQEIQQAPTAIPVVQGISTTQPNPNVQQPVQPVANPQPVMQPAVQNVVQPVANINTVQPNTIQQSAPITQTFSNVGGLNQLEKDIIDSIVGVKAYGLPQPDFVNICKQNGITDQRAAEMYAKYYRQG